jgi:hypothetical protein
MGKLLYLVGTFLLSGAIRQMLVGAGIGLVTSQFILTITNQYISKSFNSFSGVGVAMGMMGLSGLDVALSIIIGAVVARATINSLKVSFSKAA